MLTGGITRQETAEKVLANGVALVGMGTALAVTLTCPIGGARDMTLPGNCGR